MKGRWMPGCKKMRGGTGILLRDFQWDTMMSDCHFHGKNEPDIRFLRFLQVKK
jgi:hypothetical protein